MDAQTGSVAAVGELTSEMFTSMGPRERKRRGMADETTTAAACAICLEDFEFGDSMSVMPCSHRFHVGCLAKWLPLSRLCPCCRRALPVVSRDAGRLSTTGMADGGTAAVAMAAANEGGGAAERARQMSGYLGLNGTEDDDLAWHRLGQSFLGKSLWRG